MMNIEITKVVSLLLSKHQNTVYIRLKRKKKKKQTEKKFFGK